MKISKLFLLFLILSGIISCTPEKKFFYLQDKNDTIHNRTSSLINYKIRPRDVLYIDVIPFNEATSLSLTQNTQANSIVNTYLTGYVVDDSGYVNLPLAGKIYVKDLTVEECQLPIQKAVNVYLKNASVSVKLISFNITILGEVGHPGMITVNNSQINILQAIGMAGDLTVNGNRTQIVILRASDNNKIVNVDLTDKNIVNSPYYYLLPDDVIYVKPNHYSGFFGINAFTFTNIATITSLLTTLTTLILLFNYFKK